MHPPTITLKHTNYSDFTKNVLAQFTHLMPQWKTTMMPLKAQGGCVTSVETVYKLSSIQSVQKIPSPVVLRAPEPGKTSSISFLHAHSVLRYDGTILLIGPIFLWWVEWEMSPRGLCIWIFGLQLAALFGGGYGTFRRWSLAGGSMPLGVGFEGL